MATRMLPGFATISEFTASLTGDCGPTATLAALHELDAKRWPLTPAALRALDQDEIARGFSERNGAQNIYSLARYLTHAGVRHTLYGYNQCPAGLVHATLEAFAGEKPIIIEWANAGALPGDERGVHFHFSTCGGMEPASYLFCDGDNAADDRSGRPRPPVHYTWRNITDAQPIAMVMVDLPPPPPATPVLRIPTGWTDDGTTLRAPDGTPVLRFRSMVLTWPHGWDASDVPLAPEQSDVTPADPTNPAGCIGSVQYFTHRVLVWQQCDGRQFEVPAGAAAFAWMNIAQNSALSIQSDGGIE